ncbi:MAG: acylphosphatase [Chloroflexi bacterium]|nr:acylphosphatase [Chloroflexota bacterium]
MTKRARVIVSGRVQGVYFRAFTRQAAEERGVAGWVRNLPDGRVEAAFEGAPEAVEDMIEWAREGSPSSVVTVVAVEYEKPVGESSFTVR